MGKIQVDTFKNYVIYVFVMFEIIGTAWICGSNNHNLLKKWYIFTMVTLFGTRLYSFYRKNYLLYLFEMCYIVNLASMFSVFFDVGLEYVYPFLHGPLIGYSLVYNDALIMHDLDRTTSLAIHAFGAIVTRRLYWQGDLRIVQSFSDLTISLFFRKMLISMCCYFLWAIPYCTLYLFPFNCEGNTMIRYVGRLNKDDIVTKSMKIQYIFWHMVYVFIALVVGNLTIYCWQLDYALIIAQIMSGIIHGGWYYYKDHKFKFTEVKQDIMHIIENNLEIINSETVLFKLKEEDGTVRHLQIKIGHVPKVITREKSKDN